MKIKDISIRDYFTMKDTSEYDVFIDVIKSKNLLCGNECNLNDITFDEYHVIKNFYNSNSVISLEDIKELFIHLYKIKKTVFKSSENRFLDCSIFDLFRVKNYIKDYIVKKDKLEAKVLSSEPDYKLLAVNANERLSHFSSQLTKIRLGEQFSLDPSIIGGWKYNKVFGILAANNALDKVNKDYAKVK